MATMGPLALTFFCMLWGSGSMGLELLGAGSDLTQDLFMDLVFAYRFVNESVSLTVPLVDACRIMAPAECSADDTAEPLAVDFATTCSTPTEEQYGRYPDLQLYPILAVSVVPIYNLANSSAQLQLPVATLARIFTKEIATWDDPAIAATNPNLTTWGIPPGQPIEVVISSASLGTTVIFKKSLATFYDAFEAMAGPADSPFWGNVSVTDVEETDELQTYVLLHPYTIGFCFLRDAVMSEFAIPKLIKASGHTVAATVTSLGYAVLELGLNFGNNGEPADRLTADLEGALGANAWPIAGYAYVAMRKNTLRANATCDNVRQTVNFFQWYWTNAGTEDFAERTYSVGLPALVQQEVVARFVADIRCDGRLVYEVPSVASIHGAGLSNLASTMQLLDIVYSTQDAGTIQFAAADGLDPAQAMANHTFALTTASSPRLGPQSVTIPLLGLGYVVLSSFQITLDGATLAAILQGSITTWLDPRLTALNPGGLVDAVGQNFSDASWHIALLRSPEATADPFEDLMRAFDPAYSGTAIKAATLYTDPVTLQSTMQLTGAALSVLPLAVELNTQIFQAAFQRSDGSVVQPSPEAVQRCSDAVNVLDPSTNTVRLSAAPDAGCYPLATTVYLTIRRSSCDATSDPDGVATIAFFEWLLDSDSVDEAFLESGFSPLYNETLQATDPWLVYVSTAMASITCKRYPVPAAQGDDTLVVIIAVCCSGAGVLLLGGLFGVWLWRFTAPMRRMRKMLSNDNVAEECVEAISRLDLAAVAWLRELPKPNRIQRAFVRIITLLEDIKPFIPDQLLATLAMRDQAEGPSGNAADGAADIHQSMSELPEALRYAARSRPRSDHQSLASSEVLDSATPTLSHADTEGSADWRRNGKGPLPVSAPSDKHSSLGGGALPAQRSADWTRRRCVYMYVQFGLDLPSAEEGTNLLWLARVAAFIAGAGKAKAATIDRVSFGTVIMHWGATGMPAGAALTPATLLALELAEMGAELPADVQPSFWIRIGLGAGMCTVATLTAGGLRFFVLGGKEVATTASLVTSAVAAKFKGCVLLTSAAHQEVHYQVRCCPRVWFGDNLLWEPLGLRDKATHVDEWMYQLQEMDSHGEDQATASGMHGLFLMPRNGARPEDVRRAVDDFRDQHADQLSDQDGACLALLVATFAPLTRTQSGRQASSPLLNRQTSSPLLNRQTSSPLLTPP